MIFLRVAGLRLAALLPVMFLVVIAGIVGLLGLAFRDAGRAYAQHVYQAVLLAACALMAGRALNLPACSLQSATSIGPLLEVGARAVAREQPVGLRRRSRSERRRRPRVRHRP